MNNKPWYENNLLIERENPYGKEIEVDFAISWLNGYDSYDPEKARKSALLFAKKIEKLTGGKYKNLNLEKITDFYMTCEDKDEFEEKAEEFGVPCGHIRMLLPYNILGEGSDLDNLYELVFRSGLDFNTNYWEVYDLNIIDIKEAALL